VNRVHHGESRRVRRLVVAEHDWEKVSRKLERVQVDLQGRKRTHDPTP
jgi:hypothetical protein